MLSFISVLLFLFYFILFIYLFLAVLGLRFCARAFSSCGKRGPLFIAVRGRASHYRGLSLRSTGSRRACSVVWLTGPAAWRHVGSSQTRARTRVPCIGRQTLNHCATREALISVLLKQLKLTYVFALLCNAMFLEMFLEMLPTREQGS